MLRVAFVLRSTEVHPVFFWFVHLLSISWSLAIHSPVLGASRFNEKWGHGALVLPSLQVTLCDLWFVHLLSLRHSLLSHSLLWELHASVRKWNWDLEPWVYRPFLVTLCDLWFVHLLSLRHSLLSHPSLGASRFCKGLEMELGALVLPSLSGRSL